MQTGNIFIWITWVYSQDRVYTITRVFEFTLLVSIWKTNYSLKYQILSILNIFWMCRMRNSNNQYKWWNSKILILYLEIRIMSPFQPCQIWAKEEEMTAYFTSSHSIRTPQFCQNLRWKCWHVKLQTRGHNQVFIKWRTLALFYWSEHFAIL